MTKDKNIIFLISVIIILALFILAPSFSIAKPLSGEIKMNLEAGYDGAARIGSPVPFKISISNSGEDISGEIQVIVSTDYRSKAIHAMPLDLPSGSGKEVIMHVLLKTANRKVEARFVQDNKVLQTAQYDFKKLLPLETPVVGILSDNGDALSELKGVKLPQDFLFKNNDMMYEMAMKMRAVSATREEMTVPDIPIEVLRLDEETLPGDIKSMGGFDIIIVSGFDTSALTNGQKEALESWVKEGNILIIGTGPDAKKVGSGLPESLKPFNFSESETIPVPESMSKFTEKALPKGELDIAMGSMDGGSTVLDSETAPLAVVFDKGKGHIAVLAFDPALEPISGWDGTVVFWRKLILEAVKNDSVIEKAYQSGVYYRNYEHLASRVPETQTPPFNTLLVIIGIYILITGPAIYLFLKWRDKRDLNWLLIPTVSMVFLSVIYVMGLKTRYTEAVLNDISVVKIDQEKGMAEISTTIGVFNNKKGNMKMEYDKNLNLEVNPSREYYDYYSYNSSQTDDNSTISSKLTYGDPLLYELYDVSMWEPRYIYANKSMPVSGGIISSASIKNGIFKAVIRNTTDFDFREAFIVLGNNYIDVGDIIPGGEKEIKVSLNDAVSVKKRYDDFIDARYGQPYGNPQNKLPPNWRENNRKRNIIDNVYHNIENFNIRSTNRLNIIFIALNYDDPVYEIMVNGKEPKKFHTNLLYSFADISFEKGMEVEIPTGIIEPLLQSNDIAYYDGSLNSGVRVQTDGDVNFKFAMPPDVSIKEFRIGWSPYMPLYLKYQTQTQKDAAKRILGNNEYKFFIFNNDTSEWEEFENEFIVKENMSKYIDDECQINLKSEVKLDSEGLQGMLLGAPEIELEGVVK